MSGDRVNDVGVPIRQIRTLFSLGSLGALDDARLLEIFIERIGPDAEDAFAVIVRRHGPLVLGVCRRMLANPSDADDAFQATFLILARRASAIGHKQKLASWLHGVAVRAAKEIRRSEARRTRRENQVMEQARIESTAPDDDLAELIPLLDEELSRLPGRYRGALLACEIEGKSRRDAAQQLGISEGTLSSRLARGRKLLKDRLAARGVSLGKLPLVGTCRDRVTPHLPETLAAATSRAAAGSVSGGAASAGVVTIAERVLKIMLLTKLKAGLVAVMAIGLGSVLTATSFSVLWAAIGADPNHADPPRDVEPPQPAAKAPAKAKAPHDPRYAQVKGIVVDEAGKPMPGVVVRSFDEPGKSTSSMTDDDGTFNLVVMRPSLDDKPIALVATTFDRRLQGYYSNNDSEADYEWTAIRNTPIRIVMKPSRSVIARIVDRDRRPVAGASIAIEAPSDYTIATVKSNRSGIASLLIPADASNLTIDALKSGLGCATASLLMDDVDRPDTVPSNVTLTLEGARTIRVRAVDPSGVPLAGVPLKARPEIEDKTPLDNKVEERGFGWLMWISEKISQVKTDRDGIATFDWLPQNAKAIWFIPCTDRYGLDVDSIGWTPGQPEPITVKLVRSETIHGQVVLPDGRPAPGILLHAWGWGKGSLTGSTLPTIIKARTGTDGMYEMQSRPDVSYIVAVVDDKWAAPTHIGVAIRAGQTAEGIDFRLDSGTLIHGTVTVGPKEKPLAGQNVKIYQSGVLQEDLRVPGDLNPGVWMELETRTDDHGRYAFRVGPGTYYLKGPARSGSENITVADEQEIIHNLHMTRYDGDSISGRVVLADRRDIGVGVARISGVAIGEGWPDVHFFAIADAKGWFEGEHRLADMLLRGESADGSLAGIVKISGDDTEAVIPISPTASARGTIFGRDGKPIAKTVLECGIRVWAQKLGEKARLHTVFHPEVETDSQGRFVASHLVVGYEYEIGLPQGEDDVVWVAKVKPEKPGPIDLGALRIGHR